MNRDLLERLRRHISDDGIFSEPGRAVVAVSGGPDSVAMLDLLASLAPELGLDLVVAHVDHGIARESADVAESVARLAAHYGAPYHVARLELGPAATETAAREARYRALRRIQRSLEARYLVTAHHLDDQAETVLFRLLRGSGMAGLAGIPPSGPRGLVRPLLPFRRAELLAWLERPGSPPHRVHRDPANENPRHDRSWLRNRVLPLLSERFGAEVSQRLARVARAAWDDRAAWAAVLRSVPGLEVRVETSGAELDRITLCKYDKVLSEALLRALAREVGCPLGPTAARRLLELACSKRSGRRADLGKGWVAEVGFDRIQIVRAPRSESGLPVECGVTPDGVASWGGWEFVWRTGPAGISERKGMETWLTPGSATIRGVFPGDRLLPLGGVGRRKVRTLLMEARVPVRDRTTYPVVERRGTPLWVPGVCRSQADVPQRGASALRIEARRTREPQAAVGD